MGPTYAGILGPLAMTVVILRGLLHGASTEGTFVTATISLIAFAIVGWLVGTVAETTIDEDVRNKMQGQLDQFESEATS